MTLFNALSSKLKYWDNQLNKISLKGASPDQWCFLASTYLREELFNSTHLVICSDQDEAEIVFEATHHLNNVYFYPGHNHGLYTGILTSEQLLLQRWSILFQLTRPTKSIIVTTWEASQLLGPSRDFFLNHHFVLKKDDIISPIDLAQKLINLGYSSVSTVEEPGTFSRKGEIFDIYPIGAEAIRIHYFDDLIEEIFKIEQETQKTIREATFSEITILPSAGFLCKDTFASEIRAKIPQPQPSFKNKYEKRKEILKNVGAGNLFENFPLYIPLFFKETSTLLDWLPENSKITYINFENGQKNYDLFLAEQKELFEQISQDVESSIILPGHEFFYRANNVLSPLKSIHVDQLDIAVNLDNPFDGEVHLGLENLKTHISNKLRSKGLLTDNKFELIKSSLKQLREELQNYGNLIICYQHESSRQEIQFLIEENRLNEIGSRLHFHQGKLNEGFYYKNEHTFVLTEADLFSIKKKKTKKIASVDKDLFAEQLSTLKINDFVVHRDFGIGVYKGLESIEAIDQKNDFLVIQYEDNDKVYVPAYKLNLVQKHADGSAGIKVASLKSKKFLELKQKARNSVKKLAFDLIRLQAERKLRGGYAFSPPDHLFKEFELSFPFEETPDQQKAIFDVIEDMQQTLPMDRLVCGDVGFGKTEVAMRAAMKAVLDKKQVVVLVPTTVLALQHFHSFKKRFENFPVNVDFISRFKTAKEKSVVLQKVKDGSIDILIGTHAVLSDKLEFSDLGLLVIDEEHRFGVSHKEKLKVLKAGIDVLTMTATPIPRTLQLSFLGIRDLSLIQTAPPRRQSIKTYIIREDELTIKTAIEKELARGGQVYYVHNRVNDIEEHELFIKKLVPKARVIVAHGQMNERELEQKINDFYDYKADLLIATTIIESGIDIPNANTMIIDRADTYGLAQLHQLRGRIGRSDRKAYAYFVVPENRILTDVAQRRLQALQTYADMGSGFALASSDMEIRGVGDILGAEQSGHIEAIGLEFYMDLLQDAIHEIKGELVVSAKNIEIQTPFSAFIPNSYIPDNATRLKYYKRLSNCNQLSKIEAISAELQDVFGVAPKELQALYCILYSRIYFQSIGLRVVKVSGSQILLFFDQELLNHNSQLRDKILQFFMGKPKLYKLNPDASINCMFKDAVGQNTLLEFAKHIAGQMGVC